MTGPAITRTRPSRQPLAGAAWLHARLSLALRRTRRFTRWWGGIGGVVTLAAFLLPLAGGDPRAETASAFERAAADTLRLASRLDALRARQRDADSALSASQQAVPRTLPRSRVPTPTLASLERAIARAQREETRESYLALAEEASIRYGPRLRAVADSLAAGTTAEESLRLERTILAIAEARRRSLEEGTTAPAPVDVPTVDTAALRARASSLADSARLVDSLRRVATDEVLRLEAALTSADRSRAAVPPGVAILTVLLLGFILRTGAALLKEVRTPTVAHLIEAERAVGASVLSHVRDPLPDGPPRFKPGGVDPFRVLYLGLTATGTRTRTLIVTGEDAVVTAAAAARLAIAAAADHRTTLVAELDPEQIALARVFRDHPEPGFTDALAGAFTWREVARPVGSSDGLSLTMVPAGTSREPIADAERLATARQGFADFREGFEFTILTAALPDLAAARALVPGAPVVLCASVGITRVEAFVASADTIEGTGERLNSVVLWDAPRPVLPSRAELAALLSKRKGRTPGGSFKAVQDAIKKPQ